MPGRGQAGREVRQEHGSALATGEQSRAVAARFRLLFAGTRGELDDRWFKTASNGERVALQSLPKQRVLIAIPGETQIAPSQDTVYGLDPYLREPPPLGEVRAVRRPSEDHPDAAASEPASAARADV